MINRFNDIFDNPETVLTVRWGEGPKALVTPVKAIRMGVGLKTVLT